MSVELGCGLIAIGRPWGTTAQVPSETEAVTFLQHAYESGIRFFDTAPSYGLSEKRLGLFLDSLTPDQRAQVVVATKFGEHWNDGDQSPYADHSLDALKRSLDRSSELLGKIAILQLHKSSVELLNNPDVLKGFEYAKELGIAKMGVSASDPDTALRAIQHPLFSILQLPYNEASPQFLPPIHEASHAKKELIINRPFQMGHITEGNPGSHRTIAIEAFKLITKEHFEGVVLTGTANQSHLTENIDAFSVATTTGLQQD